MNDKTMKILKIVFISLIPFILGACMNSSKSSKQIGGVQSDFVKWKKAFPDSLTIHFPDKIGEDCISYGSSYRNTPKKILYLTLLKKVSEEERLLLKEQICAPDSCLIKIYLNRNTYGFNKKGLGNCNAYIPIPDYMLINDEGKIPDDIKYYVLETSKKVYVNHELYLRYYLPKEWKNGMTRGIGISEKENIIFYWLIMW